MPTSAELQALNSKHWGLALLFDGIQQVFVDHKDLVGYDFGGSRVGVLALSREGLSVPASIDIRGGQGNADVAKFTIRDFSGDGSLARLFGAIDDGEEDLGNVPFGFGLPISPDDDLSARTELHDKYVGIERIGPAGERHLYPVPPGFSVGIEHSIAVPALDLAGSPVTDNPIVWAGRRCCLYRIYRDHVTYPSTSSGTVSWRPFDERALLFLGTLKDQGTVSGHTWRLEADGWSSWLRKPLGIGFQPTPVIATGAITLSTEENANETGIGVQLVEHGTTANIMYGGRGFVVDVTGTTSDEIGQDISDEIDAAAAAATDHAGNASSVWEDQAGYHVLMDNSGSIMIQVAEDNVEDPKGILRVCLHRRVWAIRGYDVEFQASLDRGPEEPKAIQFEPVGNSGTFSSYANAYGPDYWVGNFYTGLAEWEETGARDNHGNARHWEPQFSGGVCVLNSDLPKGGQLVYLADAALGLGATGTSVAHPGQLDLPPLSDPANPAAGATIGGSTVNRQGLFLFFGKRRYNEEEEEFDEYQIGWCSWVAGSGGQAGLIAGDTVLVHAWLDPRDYGFERGRMLSDWVARADATPETGQIQAVPICSLTYRKDRIGMESAAVVMQRLLHTTGTSDGWDSFSDDDDAELQPGDNEPTHDKPVLRDAEIASLGLGISEDFIQSADAWSQEVSLIEEQSVLEVKVAFSPGYQAHDVFANLMGPIGWCWQLRGGRLGVFCPAHPLTLADVEVVLDRSSKAAPYTNAGSRESHEQGIRAFAPIDKFELAYNYAPHLNRTTRSAEHNARDAGFRYRTGTVPHKISGHFHRPQLSGWRERVALLSTWWARRHFPVKGWPVHLVNPGELIWPGTIVRLTDPELTDPAGEYNVVNRIAIVTATHTNLEAGTKLIDMLVLADRTNLPRLHGPIARGIGYDSATRTLYCRANEFGFESSSWRDVAQFVEQTYTGMAAIGGALRIVTKQWNGNTWAETLTGRVASVDTVTNTITLEAGTTAGTYMRDQDAIIVPDLYRDQDANSWPRSIYGVVCDEAGEFHNGTGMVPGYNWEP